MGFRKRKACFRFMVRKVLKQPPTSGKAKGRGENMPRIIDMVMSKESGRALCVVQTGLDLTSYISPVPRTRQPMR
jgi:hypothetical protein